MANPLWRLHLIAGGDGELADKARDLGVATTILPIPPELARTGDAGAGGPAGNNTSLSRVMLRLGVAAPAFMKYVRGLACAIRSIAPDLVHTNGFKMHLLGAWAAPPRMPMLWHIHDFVRARPLMARLLPLHWRHGTCVVANSHSVADDVFCALRGRVAVHTVYNAVDLARFSAHGAKLDLDAECAMKPAPRDAIRVGIIATMARWKGQETFIRALSILPPDMAVRGYVIGGPIYETSGSQYTIDELRGEAARMGIADRIGFTGFLRDTAAAMRALDVVVHASTAPEPFGLVIAEAMACGRAVIASAAGGAAEIVDAPHNALAHRPGDSAGLAEAIARLALDARLRQRLGAAARLYAERHFTRARLAAEMAPIYWDAIAAPNCAHQHR
jgi:glycosyltransferase involved in cell wall biosynthesis